MKSVAVVFLLMLQACATKAAPEIILAPDPATGAASAYASVFHSADVRTVWTAPLRGETMVVALWTSRLALERCQLSIQAATLTTAETASRVVSTPTGEDLVLSARFPVSLAREAQAITACDQTWVFDETGRETLDALLRARETGE